MNDKKTKKDKTETTADPAGEKENGLVELCKEYFGEHYTLSMGEIPGTRKHEVTVTHARKTWKLDGWDQEEACAKMTEYFKANPQMARKHMLGRTDNS
jgi:hypothetical protein